MRVFCRIILVVVLALSLPDLPATSAADRALGFVLQAESSQIDGIAAANGSNVFAGDALSTNPDGRIRLEFGANQIYVPGSSAVRLANGKDGVTAVLSNGILEFASPQGAGIAVRADDVLVRAKTSQMTHAQITLLSDSELKIATVTGKLELDLDGESYTLAPGRTYGVRIVNSGEKDQYQPRVTLTHRKLVIFLLAATAAIAAIIYIDQELHESPDVP